MVTLCTHCGQTTGEFDNHLSLREAQVAAFVIAGYQNRDIGSELFIAETTVKFHTTSIYRKLGIRKRSELIGAWYAKRLNADSVVLVHQFMDQLKSIPSNLEKGEPHG